MFNVVVLNGGRGAGSLIPSLLDNPSFNVTSIVNAYDDGKSTGEIRKFFGMLGPSDIRKVQELMLPQESPDYKSNLGIFQYRFPQSITNQNAHEIIDNFATGNSDELCGYKFKSAHVVHELRTYINIFLKNLFIIQKKNKCEFNFQDCSIMNCIYAGAFLNHERNIEIATLAIDKLFNLKGEVIPTSIENKKLVALRENGEMLYSEAEVVELRSNVLIERIYLLDDFLEKHSFERLSIEDKRNYLEQHHCFVRSSQRSTQALEAADIIIYSAGTQHSSLYPTYLSVGIAQTIADNHNALKVFVTNIGADYETPTYKASDYINGAYRYLRLSDKRNYTFKDLFSINLLNDSSHETDDSYVELDHVNLEIMGVKNILDNFESTSSRGKHDGLKLVEVIAQFLESA